MKKIRNYQNNKNQRIPDVRREMFYFDDNPIPRLTDEQLFAITGFVVLLKH